MSDLLIPVFDGTPELLRERERERLAKAIAAEVGVVIGDIYNQPLVTPVAGHAGWQELLTPPSPASGLEFTYTVPGSEVLKPLSVMARLTTSAVVAQRSLTVEFRDNSGVRYLVAGAEVTLAASQSQSFCWHPTAGTPSWPVDDCALAPLPLQFIYPTCTLAIKIGNVQAGDQIDNVRISVEKFSTGP